MNENKDYHLTITSKPFTKKTYQIVVRIKCHHTVRNQNAMHISLQIDLIFVLFSSKLSTLKSFSKIWPRNNPIQDIEGLVS